MNQKEYKPFLIPTIVLTIFTIVAFLYFQFFYTPSEKENYTYTNQNIVCDTKKNQTDLVYTYKECNIVNHLSSIYTTKLPQINLSGVAVSELNQLLRNQYESFLRKTETTVDNDQYKVLSASLMDYEYVLADDYLSLLTSVRNFYTDQATYDTNLTSYIIRKSDYSVIKKDRVLSNFSLDESRVLTKVLRVMKEIYKNEYEYDMDDSTFIKDSMVESYVKHFTIDSITGYYVSKTYGLMAIVKVPIPSNTNFKGTYYVPLTNDRVSYAKEIS